ncbi:MAG: THUMP domain-containing protein [Ignavibacteriaceae bacterium]
MDINLKDKFIITVKTHQGLEDVLTEELKQLGAENITKLTRAVSFQGDQSLLYKTNLCIRTALRVLVPIYKFKASNETWLYRGVQKVDWSKYLTEHDTLALDSAVSSPIFKNSQYVFLKAKDAIVDQFRNKTGVRPNVDLDNPTVRINVYIQNDEVTLSLDSSGSSLHKRGYRNEVNEAPLNEALAAGLILMSGWDKQSNFIDPMCGSGTILIEAAMIAYNIAPNINRKKFGFMNWKNFDKALWDKITDESKNSISKFNYSITGSDISPEATRIARNNIKSAALQDKIKVDRKDFAKITPPEGKALIIMNPPFGERIQPENINLLYKSIGDTLKQKFPGSEAWLLSSNIEALKCVGLRPSKKIIFHAGPLELRFNNYSMYSGL